jgi:hypothetical protein
MLLSICTAHLERGLDGGFNAQTFDGSSNHHLDLASKVKLRSITDLKVGRGILCPRKINNSV